jgi:hypothetical protein
MTSAECGVTKGKGDRIDDCAHCMMHRGSQSSEEARTYSGKLLLGMNMNITAKTNATNNACLGY